MRIVRARRTSRYTVLSNDLIEDARLSFKARGLLAYLLSRPDGWQTDAHRLAANGPDGRSAILSALKEIERVGYLVRTRTQDERGRWATASEVFDTPAEVRFSDVGSSDVGKPNPKESTEARPPNPQSEALGEPCPRHKSLGRPHARCRACGTAGKSPVPTPVPPSLVELARAKRCEHGEIYGRCALCRTQRRTA